MSKVNLVNRAKNFCEMKKYRFTIPRERVLTALAKRNKPMGAYQIIETLSTDKEKINPPTVYRAIEFWIKHGFIHRIESMNAYIACCGFHKHENFCMFICNNCNMVTELTMDKFPSGITEQILNKGMTIMSSFTEIYGKCCQCN
ncbi:MAG: Fur family transcriptional regulator [Gammaproteobacteria bacterium]